jgi:Zn-finger nucleic acid-binding protein
MAHDAESLHCPNCGAPAAPDDASCRYCHATLATISCPACFALMFAGAMYCPACGARRARTEGAARRAPCPACRGVMREIDVGDASFLECERCHATWLDAPTFEHICADRGVRAAVLHRSSTRPLSQTEVRYRKCVACGAIMNRLNFGRLSGTIVDVCKGHGTFLDAGELHAIVQFIEGGGLDRARERQIEDLKEEERRLRLLQNPGHGSTIETRIESSSWSESGLRALLDQLR